MHPDLQTQPQTRLKDGVLLAVLASTLVSTAVPAQVPDLYDENSLRTFELTFASKDWFAKLVNSYPADTNLSADLKVDGRIYKNVGVRARGKTSYNWGAIVGKLPLRITMDAATPGGNLYGHKSLILNNGFADPTFCREVIAYRIMATRVPAPRINFVKLVVNGVSRGVFTSVEAPNRDFLRRRFAQSNGNRYQGNFAFCNIPIAKNQLPSFFPLKSSVTPTAYVDLGAMMDVVQRSSAVRESQLPDSIDVHGCLRQIAVDTITGQYDGVFGHNYYLYNDPTHRRFVTIPWDLNYAFRKTGAKPYAFIIVKKLVEPNSWMRRYQSHVRSLTAEFCDWKVIGSMVARQHRLIDAAVKVDTRGYGYAAFKANVIQPVGLLPGLKPTVDALRQAILGDAVLSVRPPTISALVTQPKSPTEKDRLWVSARVSGTPSKVTLYYRRFGRFQTVKMHDDGKHADGAAADGRFGAAIPAQIGGAEVEYYLSADNALAEALLPAAGGYRAFSYRVSHTPGSIVINELVSRNTSGLKDRQGEHDDWIELYNRGAASVAIGGMYLSDDAANPTKWRLPAGLSLSSGQRLLI